MKSPRERIRLALASGLAMTALDALSSGSVASVWRRMYCDFEGPGW
ncbi:MULTISPECIES: hypothetical protein [Lelliottia]